MNVNIQLLRDIPVVHFDRHIKPDAAHFIDHILEQQQIHNRIAVDIESCQPLDMHTKAVNACSAALQGGTVNSVELSYIPGNVDQRVTRNADAVNCMIVCVKPADYHGVSALADLVNADKENGVHAILSLQCRRLLGEIKRSPVRKRFRCGGRFRSRGRSCLNRLLCGLGSSFRFGSLCTDHLRRPLPPQVHQAGSCCERDHQTDYRQYRAACTVIFFSFCISHEALFL